MDIRLQYSRMDRQAVVKPTQWPVSRINSANKSSNLTTPME